MGERLFYMGANLSPMTRKMKPVWKVILGLMLFCAFYWFALHVYARGQQDQVLEAVLRDTFKTESGSIVFVSIDDADPSDQWLRRFQDASFSVAKFSAALDVPEKEMARSKLISQRPMKRFRLDNTSQLWGLHFYLQSPTWISPFHAEVFSSTEHRSEHCTVIKKGDQWVVASRQIDSIS